VGCTKKGKKSDQLNLFLYQDLVGGPGQRVGILTFGWGPVQLREVERPTRANKSGFSGGEGVNGRKGGKIDSRFIGK